MKLSFNKLIVSVVLATALLADLVAGDKVRRTILENAPPERKIVVQFDRRKSERSWSSLTLRFDAS